VWTTDRDVASTVSQHQQVLRHFVCNRGWLGTQPEHRAEKVQEVRQLDAIMTSVKSDVRRLQRWVLVTADDVKNGR
jgi:hypothetical protein